MEQYDISKGIGKFKKGAEEVMYGLVNLKDSFKQNLKENIEEAKDFLSCLQNNLPEQNPYFTKEEKPSIVRRVDSGFHSGCYEFTSSKGKWVIKIGYDKAPMKTQFHPSQREYAESYMKNLEIQRAIFGSKLPNFIPEPQGVFYVQGQKRATTVIVQPFIEHISSFNKKIKLNPEESRQLENELGTLLDLISEMRKDYGITPDFMRAGGKKGHFVIVRKEDGVHLVMLDNDVFDEKWDKTPLLVLVNRWLAEGRIKKRQKELKHKELKR